MSASKPRRKSWPRVVQRKQLAPGVTEITVDDGLRESTHVIFASEVAEYHWLNRAVDRRPEAEPAKIPPLNAPEGALLVLKRLGRLHKKTRSGRRAFRTAADRRIWRALIEEACVDAGRLLSGWLEADRLVRSGPDATRIQQALASIAQAAYRLGARLTEIRFRAAHLVELRKRRNAAEARPTRTESPAWRAVRLAWRQRRNAPTGKLWDVYQRAAQDTEGAWPDGVAEVRRDSFEAGLSRRKAAWRKGQRLSNGPSDNP